MGGLPAAFSSTLMLAARRVWSYGLLTACLVTGLAAAVALLSSIPMYADAAHHRLLAGELAAGREAGTGAARPPFAFLWRYVGAWHGDVTWAAYQPVDGYLSQQAADAIGLPAGLVVRHVKTAVLPLFAGSGSGFQNREPLLWASVGFVDGLDKHIAVVEGRFPAGSSVEGDGVPVVVSEALAGRAGLQPGERYVLFGGAEEEIAVRVAGVWRALDPGEPFWFYPPESFDEVLLTSEGTFEAEVVPALDRPVSLAAWYLAMDGRAVRAPGAARLLRRIAAVQSRAAALLPHTGLDVSPADALEAYRRAAGLLTIQLGMFSLPLVGLVLYFVALIARLAVGRSQAEIAVLRSRGTTRVQVMGITLLEGVWIGSAGLAAGLVLGRLLAQAMGRMHTFLDPAALRGPDALDVSFSPAAVGCGLVGVVLAMAALAVPALAAARHTVVTHRWSRARALLRPMWQRAFLDVALLAPTLYGWYVLRRQGTVAAAGSDPLSNPLLFLVPALFCFSLALLFARLFPALMAALAGLAARLPGVTPLLALRELARSGGRGERTGPLLLIALTLGLAIFSASMAATLDGHLHDGAYYRVGADMALAEMGETAETAAGEGGEQEAGPRWLFLPVGEHLRVAGVRAAARVGDYAVAADVDGSPEAGRLLGVDRLDFPAVAYFEPGFAGGESLGGLMNRLAAAPAHLLASRDFMARHGLQVGDPLRLTVTTGGGTGAAREIQFVIAAALDLFPTLYPQDGPFFVGNLEYIFEGLGGMVPYDVWLAADPAVPAGEIAAGVRALGLPVVRVSDARAVMAAEQVRPGRQGVLGLLSAGFGAAAGLTALGFLVYAVVSFQRRFIELGMLRAVGLSAGQLAGYLAAEQALLVTAGAGLGTGLGVAASRLFIPFLQVGGDKTAQVPPFVVHVAWGELWSIYALFGALLVAAVVVLGGLLARLKVFEAIKLGEVG